MGRVAWLPLLAMAGAWSVAARADDRAMCSGAYVAAQTRRAEHKLLAARTELRTCARQECASLMKGQMAKDCTTWLTQVEASIPSVVLSAKDDAGTDVTDVRVAVDGAVIATALDGRAIDLDPGSHVFTFEIPGEAGSPAKVSVTALILEGTKDQLVRATLHARSPGASPGLAPARAAPEPHSLEVQRTQATLPAASDRFAPTTPTRANGPLLVSGIVSLSVGYVAALVGGAIELESQGSGNGGCFGSPGLSFIPLAGPLAVLASYADHQVVTYASSQGAGSPVVQVADCNGGRSSFTAAVIADEILQLGGLGLLTSGMLVRSRVESSELHRAAPVAIFLGAPGTPLGATLRLAPF